jgi:hypothetical protein
MSEELTYEQKVDKFVRLMNDRPLDDKGKPVSNAECCRQAGWPQNRCYKTSSELLAKPEIRKRIRQMEEATRVAESQTDGSVHSILDANINKAVLEMAKGISSPRGAKEFIATYDKLKKQKVELEGQWDGCSIGEIKGELNRAIADAQSLMQRINEAIGTGEVQEESSVLLQGDTGVQGYDSPDTRGDKPEDML